MGSQNNKLVIVAPSCAGLFEKGKQTMGSLRMENRQCTCCQTKQDVSSKNPYHIVTSNLCLSQTRI